MPSLFERTLELDVAPDGVYERHIDTTWWGWNGQFGGYVLALVLEACRRQNVDPTQRERSLTMHFLRRHPQGRCRIEVTTERQGRTVTTFGVRLSVDGVLCSVGLALFASDRRSEEYVTVTAPPDNPPAAGEEPGEQIVPGEALSNVHVWPRHRSTAGDGGPVDRAGGWMSLVDPGGADERFALVAADGFLPVSSHRATRPSVGGTLDFTAHFRHRVPEAAIRGDEPVRVDLVSAAAHQGYVDEDCCVWSAGGVLLLQSRQVRYSEIVDDPAMLAEGLRPGQ